MPASKFSLTKIKIINQKLDRLIDFKRNLIFSLEKKPANITKVNDTVHPNNEIELSDKTILTEILETKKKGDLENYIHFSLLKEINVIIDELFLLFHLTQELDKEIMLLIDRMKEAKKNNAELKRFEEFLNETNKLENMERVKILIMLGMMQALNERYALLKTEKIKAHQSFTQDMLPTLENLQKDDGMHLTRSQKEEINDDLVKKEIELIERLLKIEDNKAESRAKLNINHPQVPSKDVAQFILPMFRAENRNQSSYKKIISSSSFKKAHETLVKETLQIHRVTNPNQTQKVAEDRVETIKSNVFLEKFFKIHDEQNSIKAVNEQIQKIALKETRNLENENLFLSFDLEPPINVNRNRFG